jgi:hypothetical protein
MRIRAWFEKAAAKIAALWNGFSGFVRRHKTRIKHIGIGRAIYDTTSWLFDNPLYIAMIAAYGPILGGSVMLFLSLVICFTTLVVYERMKIEWTGIDVVDHLKERGIDYARKINSRGKHKTFRQLFARIVFFIPAKIFVFLMNLLEKHGNVAAFFILSVIEDPFYAVAYLRRGQFDGLKKKDYLLFISSVIFSNGYWILRNWGIIEAARFAWKLSEMAWKFFFAG